MFSKEAPKQRRSGRTTIVLALAALVAFAAVLAGCGSDDGGDGSGDLSVGLSVNGAPLPFYETVRESAEEKAAADGVDLRVVTPTSPEEQNRATENLLVQGIDVLGVAPIDATAIVPVVEASNADDVPVITIDETAEEGEIYTYIASPNDVGGRLAGEWLVEELGGKGKLAVVEGESGSSTNNARMDGLKEALEGSDIEIVASSPGDWLTDKAFQAARDMLTANPDVNAFFGVNDTMAVGIAQAVEQAGLRDQVKIIGYNGDPIAFDAIRDGTMDATVAQDPAKMGELLIENAVAAADGKAAKEETINVPVEVVDAQNIDKAKGQ